MNVDPNNKFIAFFVSIIQHYNHKKYWNYRVKVINPESKIPKLFKLFMLLYIKRCDAFNCASMGTDLNQGAVFLSPPTLPHGLNGIIVYARAKIGKNCKIYQQVLIGYGKGGAPTIGNNVTIYAGAKITGAISIGDNCIIAPNSVVTKSIPPNTVVGGVNKILRSNESQI